uniref:Uncharacterized protein n=1 Tax=Tanacetum cinerariifolium TaxID=118510 RepID=A0A6L2JI29_TANCI|nr:hypothetical protein [Tanacetum cinerariifolium]
MDLNNDMLAFYEYYSTLDMDQYTQYCGYLEQLEALEEDEAESSEKHTRRYIAREQELAKEKLRQDYFGDENTPPMYPEEYFRQRQRPDCTGRLGFSPLLKCTLAIRQLAYGTSPDAFDEYLRSDGIYPQWATFVKAFSIARDQKTMKFKRVQESARKDIERVFDVLQDQIFDISEYWHMYTSSESNIQPTWVERFERQRRRNKELRDMRVHEDLQHDIVEHLWNRNIEI